MVHAPELLGYEQYTPFPAACQWQSERPPPVAGAFAGLFMALGAPLLAWERPALTAGLPRAFARGPAPFVAANSTYSLRLRLSPSEGRPALAGRSSSLPWGPQAPILAEGHAKNRQTSPASFFSSPLPFWLGAYCHLQGPPKSVDFGRKTGRTAAHRVCLGGRRPPFWRKGTPKTGKRRPPHFSARLSPFGLAPTVIYRAHPSLWTSEGRPALAGRSTSLPWGPQAPFWRKGTPKTGKRRPPHFLARLSPFGLAPTVIYRAHPSLWTSEGRPALAGRSSSLPWGP